MQRAGRTWLPDGDSYFAPFFAHEDVFEEANLLAGLAHVTEWDAAIDGGAHVGSWSRYLADRFRHVFAFEPERDNFSCLLANMKEAGKLNVECHRTALGSVYRSVGLAPGTNSGCWHIDDGSPRSVMVMPLDAFRPVERVKVGYLKLDVEGYEWHALTGARKLLERDRPVVQIEEKPLAHAKSYRGGSARELLEGMGYKQVAASGRDVVFAWA